MTVNKEDTIRFKEISELLNQIVIKKTTKNGKAFMRWKCVDSDNRSGWLRVWGNLDDGVEFSTWLADVKNDAGWGMSSSLAKLKKINAFD